MTLICLFLEIKCLCSCKLFLSLNCKTRPKMKNSNNSIPDFVLNFGKFKGQQFSTTPSWYQEWLPKQSWFKMPQSKPLHQQLRGWDGNSRKGEAIYDAIFQQEKAEALKQDCFKGICSCCQDSMYYGI